jgi:glutamine amidotransferase
MEIIIVDYGVGNVGSLVNMLNRVTDAPVSLSKEPDELASVSSGDKVFLPGVGNFGFAMRRLDELGLTSVLQEMGQDGDVDMLGICLGAQLLLNASEEAAESGLGIIPGRCKKFDPNDLADGLRIPHMGWSEVQSFGGTDLSKIPLASRFYFVHSYHMMPEDSRDVLFTANHGHSFNAGIIRNRCVGVQFHPEKSHKHGMAFLKEFINWKK